MEKLKQIELIKPHRHAGRDYPPGALLSLPVAKADWLIGVGSARHYGHLRMPGTILPVRSSPKTILTLRPPHPLAL